MRKPDPSKETELPCRPKMKSQQQSKNYVVPSVVTESNAVQMIAYPFQTRAGFFTTLVENMMPPEKYKSNSVDRSVVTEKDVNRSTGDSILCPKHTGSSVFTD